jgi:hypothetical protein
MGKATAGSGASHNMQSKLEAINAFESQGAIFDIGSGKALFAWGPTVPADAVAGYNFGCLFIHTDGTNQADALYCNIGSDTSADFNLVTVAA